MESHPHQRHQPSDRRPGPVLDTASASRLLVVDEEPRSGEDVRWALSLSGFEVAATQDELEALQLIQAGEPDAVIVDLLGPRVDGLRIRRRVRQSGSTLPVLLLGAARHAEQMADGLGSGLDDFLVKPFDFQDLLIRVRTLLRRKEPVEELEQDEVVASRLIAEQLAFEDLILNRRTREVTRSTRTLRLTPTEYRLLELFLRNPEAVLDRTLISRNVWGSEATGYRSNALNVHVGLLRRKLEAEGRPRLIHTMRGVGYVLRREGANS